MKIFDGGSRIIMLELRNISFDADNDGAKKEILKKNIYFFQD